MTSLRSRHRKTCDPFYTCINDGHLAIALYIANRNNISGGKSITFSMDLFIEISLPISVLSHRGITTFIRIPKQSIVNFIAFSKCYSFLFNKN